jgi:putative restriction endonuclease
MLYEESKACVIVARRHADYDDEPWSSYHYPKARYHDRITGLKGALTLVFEPRRGGRARGSASGGRSAFVGLTYLGDVRDDPVDQSHAYVEMRDSLEFPVPVPLASVGLAGPSLQHAVREIPWQLAESVVRIGLGAILFEQKGVIREGLVDLHPHEDFAQREVREVLSRRSVRDASFRFRVVQDVYEGRCALSGLKLTNGYGRAEVDAAHIRPVARGGPDSVRNGLALSKTLHWAFDRGLLSLSDDMRILVVDRGVDDAARRLLLPSGAALVPPHPDDQPHASYLRWHRENVFKGDMRRAG